MRRFWLELLALGLAGAALGLGVAWAERTFGIPKNVVQLFWFGLLAAAVGFAVWAGWRYYRESQEDDWD